MWNAAEIGYVVTGGPRRRNGVSSQTLWAPNGSRLSCGAESAAAAPMMEVASRVDGAQAQFFPSCEAPSASSAC